MSLRNWKKTILHISLFVLLTTFFAAPLNAQTDDLNALKEKAGALFEQQKYTEALPLLEKIAAAEPEDGRTQFLLGFALLAQAKNTKEKETVKQLTIRARKSFVKARELGVRENVLDALIASIPESGEASDEFSKNAEANSLMKEGESLFTQGKIDDALAAYQKALKLDPKIYEAALFSGDMYMRKDDFANAEIWYQKAIAINPNRETAYRYSATPLMKQRKFDQARERYIEAYIVEPYNRFSSVGITQWAQATNTDLAHPKIDIPASVTENKSGGLNITLGMGDKEDDGSFAWTVYALTRAAWRTGKDNNGLSENFRKAYPNESKYRHSLAEEYDALKSTVIALKESMSNKKSKIKQLNPSLVNLVKLHDAGLLEAYILLAQPNRDIAQEHAAYLKQNRDKLRRYVVEYVVGNSGK